jgi:hypothetical protein
MNAFICVLHVVCVAYLACYWLPRALRGGQ